MTGLDIIPETLAAEKSVVIEEYNQRYLNQPYGDQWLLLRALAYTTHPYRWPTIGMTPDHIREASIEDVRAFYNRYYRASNAILAVSGNLEPEQVFALAEKWFGHLDNGSRPEDTLPQEPVQEQPRRQEVRRDVPATQITIAFHMCDRRGDDYYVCDMMSDLLAGGTSARLYRDLVKDRRLFAATNAYITGDLGPGLFVVTGQLMPGVTVETGEAALWEELERLAAGDVSDGELLKVGNKFEANMSYGELNVMNKALNMAYYSMLGDLPLMNREADIYRTIDNGRIAATAGRMFRREGSSTLIIHGNDE